MERIRDKPNEERYNRMIQRKENELSIIKEQIEKYKNIDITVKKKKEQIKTFIDLLDDIIANGSINKAHLRMLIDKIIIYEKDDKLDIKFQIKADFQTHYKLLVS